MALSGAQRRDLRLIATLRGVSFFGDQVAIIALILRVAHGGASSAGLAVAAVAIANMLPPVLLTPLSGMVVDRVRAKVLLIPVTLAQGVVALALGLFTNTPITLVLIAVLGVGVAFTQPGYGALVPALVGEENIAKAQGTMQAAQSIAVIAGPAVGGLLVGTLGTSWPLYLDALTFVLCAIGTAFIRGDRVPADKAGDDEPANIWAGVHLLFRDAVLRPITAEALVFVMAIGIADIAAVFLIVHQMHASTLDYGMFQATFGLGLIVGALYSGRQRSDADVHVRLLFFALAVLGATFALVGVSPNVWIAMIPMAIGGIADGVIGASAWTVFTLRSDDAIRGRVFAAVNAVFTGMTILSIGLGGSLVTVITARTLFVIGGGLSLLSVLVFGPTALRASRRAIAANAQGEILTRIQPPSPSGS